MNKTNNPVPFYTLNDAAIELNRILNVDYYDKKKMLSLALAYDIKLHIMVFGWNVVGDYSHIISPNTFRNLEPDQALLRSFIQNTYEHLNTISDAFVQNVLDEGGLISLTNLAIRQLYFKNKLECDDIHSYFSDNLIAIDEILNHEEKNLLLEHYKFKADAIQDEDQKKFSIYKAIDNINILYINLLVNEEESKSNYLIPKPNKLSSYKTEDGEQIYYPKIKIKDVVIIHPELMRIAENRVNRLPVHPLLPKVDEYKPTLKNKRPGKSNEKANAQLAAKTIATHVWKNDSAKQIKTGEMCEIVWNTLIETQHVQELPDKQESLKDWIKDVAPEYAKEPGRPKNT
ncbi:hypothetical protein EGK59_05705 [Acinetobacter soli]|uniref:hypothetical protein n=1 Tax=Acinetobacter soli TaxID=487316 RepID=UPI000F67F6E1|nr:hypothetical protein [Acinetobacter soli]RSB55082.1 hypothetical protein EGK59_05705 [Acinetobacter soli]